MRARAWLGAATVAAVLTSAAAARGEQTARNTLTANPIRFALLHFQIDYERAIGSRVSLFVAPIAFHHATWYPFARAPDIGDDDRRAASQRFDPGVGEPLGG